MQSTTPRLNASRSPWFTPNSRRRCQRIQVRLFRRQCMAGYQCRTSMRVIGALSWSSLYGFVPVLTLTAVNGQARQCERVVGNSVPSRSRSTDATIWAGALTEVVRDIPRGDLYLLFVRIWLSLFGRLQLCIVEAR